MKKRIISSIIAAPILIYVVIKGGFVLSLGWYIIIAISLFELNRMVFGKFDMRVYFPALLFLSALFFNNIYNYNYAEVIVSFYIIIMFIINIIIVRYYSLSKISLAIIGTLYIVHLANYLINLAEVSFPVLVVSFVVAWSYDAFAYFTGIKWGKRRPWPELSPKKSVEGVIGGSVGCLLISLIFAVLNNWNLVVILFYAVGGIILAQSGDLIESSIKRFCEVKDSGNILPGHGGMLDRFDSVLPVLPLTYLIFVVLKLQ